MINKHTLSFVFFLKSVEDGVLSPIPCLTYCLHKAGDMLIHDQYICICMVSEKKKMENRKREKLPSTSLTRCTWQEKVKLASSNLNHILGRQRHGIRPGHMNFPIMKKSIFTQHFKLKYAYTQSQHMRTIT